ncbi:TPA: S9 family peptidase, partial [Candidatus Uhrbacteria bacterium]|nr:S9 family peptidase [Candidatus Uhrbacteria bacterium]
GKLWLERGGIYALANIRGGGEFGPLWHKAALKHDRQKAYDDFHAITEALIYDKVTTSRQLGIEGGSNGGLLMGVAFTQRPDLYHAVVCQVPLLDMLRYHELPPGASWIGEYGDPRIQEDYEVLASYSPYQNLFSERHYPKVFFITSSKDDRVHPAHARKMAAKMESFGYPFFYYENVDGGHGAGKNPLEKARRNALEYTYLWKMLKN